MTHPIPDEALDADIAILGRKGRGKTYTAKGIVERLLDMKRRVVIMDPLSTWWGLRSSADGKKPGYPIAVFGGPHGDMPLKVSMAEPLAEIIARENMPCVIDYGDLSRGEIQRFAMAFLSKLYQKNREPLTVVLEEADVLAPQNPMGDQAEVFSIVDKIARRGRNFGFRLITMTQRAARLHKDVLSQSATLVALGVTSPQDRDAMKAWVEGNGDREQAKTVFESMGKLAVGEGWVWASELGTLDRVKFPRIKTLDTSATPKAGESRIQPKSLAEVDLASVKAALEAPEPAARPKVTAVVDTKAIEAARAEGYAKGHEDGYVKGYRSGTADSMKRAIEAIHRLAEAEAPSPAHAVRPAPVHRAPATPVAPRAPRPAVSGPNPLVEAARDIWPVKLTWAALCATNGRKARGGHFNTQKKAALESGEVVEQGGLVILTDPPDTSGAVPADLLAERLPGGARELFSAIRERPGHGWEDYADMLGRKAVGGHWNTSKAILRNSDLIDDAGGRLRIKSELETA